MRRSAVLACGAAAFCCLLLFDTGALARLLWSGLRGPVGAALAVAILAAWLWRRARRPPARPPRKRPRAARRGVSAKTSPRRARPR